MATRMQPAHAADTGGTTDFQEGSTPKKVVVITLGSLAIVALGGAVASNLQELVLTDRRNDLLTSAGNRPGGGAQCGAPAACTSLRDLNDSIEGARSRWAPLAFTSGGLLLATLGSLLLWPAAKKETAFRVMPIVGQQSGVALGGRF